MALRQFTVLGSLPAGALSLATLIVISVMGFCPITRVALTKHFT